ncbi:methyltransferase domain-containing protein [Niastella caeni]|uniref:Methyltransferase domain-containing protein n=1 Tax=Niastella caeni TaxID=2569763 RepID=A0A4S8HID4_9BACT|nr:methyltransferase domain-containing protein [Niastella caeni]THU34970.1 methyltransferase domain-containing protein [Niastella caeni]
MSLSLQLQHVVRPGYTIDLFVPNAQEVQNNYFRQKQVQAQVPFPHWTKLWPAALAMGDFIYKHPELVQNKNVLELAAGLGLPSFMAARYAKTVCCSDYLEEAVATMAKSARHLQLPHVTCQVLDWNQLPDDLTADVLLLSDINYDPDQFDQLYQVMQRFLQQGTVILLTTPQRLMAKPFIEKLLPFCRQQYEMSIYYIQEHTPISLLVLEEQHP